MKNTFNSFVLIDYQNSEIKTYLDNIIDEFVETLNVEAKVKSDDLITILLNCDINEDIREALKSLIQDFDGNVFVLEGFRFKDEAIIEKVKKAFKNNHSKNYMRVSDLLNKCNEAEAKAIKEFIITKIEKDNYLKQIIFSMFDNNLNITKTANAVYMHRNSINNKLDSLEKETGINIQVFNEAVTMYNILKR